MIVPSDIELFDNIRNGNYVSECRVVINGVAYGEDVLISVDSSSSVFGNESPSIGNACAMTITINMLVPKEYIPECASVVLQIRIKNDEFTSEWVDRGHYWIDVRKIERNANGEPVSMNISAFDSMIRAEKDYEVSKDTWISKTDAQILNEICSSAMIVSGWTPNKGYKIESAPEDMTGREIIGYIAGMYGGNAIIDSKGRLQLVQLSNGTASSFEFAEKMYTGETMSPFDSVIVHKMNGTKFEAVALQSVPGIAMNFDCHWGTQAMAQNILNAIAGYRYQPFEITTAVIDPLLEIGDTILFNGISERVYSMNIEYRKRLVATISAPDRNECTHDFKAPSSGGGGGGGSAGKKKSDKEELRFARQDLVADIDDVKSGLYAVVSADDIKNIKEAKTTLFAKIYDEDNNESVVAKLVLNAKQIGDVTKSVATLQAEHINLVGVVDVQDGSLHVARGTNTASLTVRSGGNLIADGIDLRDSNGLYIDGYGSFKPTTITFANGTFNVLTL